MNNNNNTTALLDKAQETWINGSRRHRDAMLEVGNLLHRFIIEGMEERDAIPSIYDKGNCPITRESFIKQAAEKLQTTRATINMLIACAMVIELLSHNGDAGSLSLEKIRWFAVKIRRKNSIKLDGKVGRGNIPWRRVEEWEIKDTDGPELFQKAVQGNWTCKQLWGELHSHNTANRRFPGGSASRKGIQEDKTTTATTTPINIIPIISASLPRDAAEFIHSAILQNESPRELARQLVTMLTSPDFIRLARDAERNNNNKKKRTTTTKPNNNNRVIYQCPGHAS